MVKRENQEEILVIFEKIKKIIVEHLRIDEEEVKMETSFDDLVMDSLDLFQIIIEIEEQFDIRIEEPEKIKTVLDAVEFVRNGIK